MYVFVFVGGRVSYSVKVKSVYCYSLLCFLFFFFLQYLLRSAKLLLLPVGNYKGGRGEALYFYFFFFCARRPLCMYVHYHFLL